MRRPNGNHDHSVSAIISIKEQEWSGDESPSLSESVLLALNLIYGTGEEWMSLSVANRLFFEAYGMHISYGQIERKTYCTLNRRSPVESVPRNFVHQEEFLYQKEE